MVELGQLPVSPWKLHQAARTSGAGGLIAYPTEAVYGLGCDPLNPAAVYRLLKLKQRPVEKGLILIAADFRQLLPFIRPLSKLLMQRVLASWPGPNTWLLPAALETPTWLTGSHSTLAVRVTAHPIAAALCRACNSPLVSTSANRGGLPPARSPLQVLRQLGPGAVDLILHGPLGKENRPSQIRDGQTGAHIRY